MTTEDTAKISLRCAVCCRALAKANGGPLPRDWDTTLLVKRTCNRCKRSWQININIAPGNRYPDSVSYQRI